METTDLQKNCKKITQSLDQFSKPVFGSVPQVGAWRAGESCACLLRGRGPGEGRLPPGPDPWETRRRKAFPSLSLMTTERTVDFPVSKPHHRHLQLLHSALPAHKEKKEAISIKNSGVCVCPPREHGTEEVNLPSTCLIV